MKDLIINNYNGFIIQNFDINLYVVKLIEYLDLSEEKKKLIRINSRNSILNKCSENSVNQQLYKFYKSL